MKYFIVLFFLVVSGLFSVEIKYKWDIDYRIESTVYQNVKQNRKIILSSTIENRYTVKIKDKSEDYGVLDITQSVFQQSAGLTAGYYIHQESHSGDVKQFINGQIEPLSIPSFPSIQNVPVFPSRNIEPGDSWTSIGLEYFDLNKSFNIDDVISTQFRVFYNYEKNIFIDNNEYAVFNINYNIYEQVMPQIHWEDMYPLKINGSSKQILFWDIEKGRPHSLEDKYFLEFTLSTGDVITFSGYTQSMSKPKKDLKEEKFRQMITNFNSMEKTAVVESEEQVKIIFQSLLFDGESADLREDVKAYLDSIGQNIKDIGNINIRINGHTARLGNDDRAYLLDLSKRRALSVANYLVEKGYLEKRNIEIIGHGGDFPIESNNTTLGRSINRRVEIDILKN